MKRSTSTLLLLFIASICYCKIVQIEDDDQGQKHFKQNRNGKKPNLSQQDFKADDSIPKSKFKGWMKKYLKNYGPEEQSIRLFNLERNSKKIAKHNENKQKMKYKMGLNKFADLTDEQFQSTYLMKPDQSLKIMMTAPIPEDEECDQENRNRLLQTYDIDWRRQVEFGPIKDQGRCAACYAFANIGSIQLNWAIKYRTKAPSLSQQQIVDCCNASGYKCDGCTTGNLGSTFSFLSRKGISTTQSYPFTGTPSSCKQYQKKSYLRLDRPFYQMTGIRSILYYLQKGPLTVALDARTWKFYQEGIFNECPETDLKFTHAAVVIGATTNGEWIIRNSWGDDWGELGYITMEGGASCGIDQYVFYPNIA